MNNENSLNDKKISLWLAYRFPIILLLAIAFGSIVGLVMGEKATVFKPLGDIFLNMMFTIVVPLVFLTISSAVGNMLNMKRLGKILKNLFLVFIITGLIASVIMICTVTVFQPGQGVNISVTTPDTLEKVSIADQAVKAITAVSYTHLTLPTKR